VLVLIEKVAEPDGDWMLEGYSVIVDPPGTEVQVHPAACHSTPSTSRSQSKASTPSPRRCRH
jgi:hypothetical protein